MGDGDSQGCRFWIERGQKKLQEVAENGHKEVSKVIAAHSDRPASVSKYWRSFL